jgi:hypothetical protein
MSILLVVSALLWAGQAPKATAPALPLVCVTTNDQGGADDLKGRQESVKDLRAALADKKKHLVVVDQEDRADFVVHVMERTTTTPRILFTPMEPGVAGPVSSGPSRAVHLRVTIVRGSSDPEEFTNKGTAIESRGGWRFAADDLAKQIDKWIVDHAKARTPDAGRE